MIQVGVEEGGGTGREFVSVRAIDRLDVLDGASRSGEE